MKSTILAEEYRARAATETSTAMASVLQQVRDKHTRAAAIWTGLADAEEFRARMKRGGEASGVDGAPARSLP